MPPRGRPSRCGPHPLSSVASTGSAFSLDNQPRSVVYGGALIPFRPRADAARDHGSPTLRARSHQAVRRRAGSCRRGSRGPAGRGPRDGRGERRRQVHAPQDPERGGATRCRRPPLRGRPPARRLAARQRGLRHRHHLPGIHPHPRAHGDAEYLSGTRDLRPRPRGRAAGRHAGPDRQPGGRSPGPDGRIGWSGSGPTGAGALGSGAPDGGDRPRAVSRIAADPDGRADRHAHHPGDGSPARDRAAVARARGQRPLHLASPGGSAEPGGPRDHPAGRASRGNLGRPARRRWTGSSGAWWAGASRSTTPRKRRHRASRSSRSGRPRSPRARRGGRSGRPGRSGRIRPDRAGPRRLRRGAAPGPRPHLVRPPAAARHDAARRRSAWGSAWCRRIARDRDWCWAWAWT